MVAELAALGTLVLVGLAEYFHWKRSRRLAPLAFGPGKRPAPWALFAPVLRMLSLGAVVWGLVTLFHVEPRIYRAGKVEPKDYRHVMLLLDVSPSMKLQDAGPNLGESRRARVLSLMESFFERVPMGQVRLSVVAVYNGAKPVVVDTRDVEVVRNFLDGMDMYTAFESGKTKLFDGLEEAFKIAKDWKPGSTTLIILTDGDTVPATGMPQKPASVKDVLVVGVGDPAVGSFIDGRQSRQDVATLRQIAARLGGEFHDGNQKHLPTSTIRSMTTVGETSELEKLGKREYALMALGLGTLVFALLPVLLNYFGTRWRPGVPHGVTHQRKKRAA